MFLNFLFQTHELLYLQSGMRREDLAVHVRRDHVFEDSYRELFRRTPEEWKHRLYIVFEGEISKPGIEI